jgi:putative membrane protein
MKIIVKILLSALVVMFLAWLLPGVNIKEGFWYALIVAAVIGLLNGLVRPLLILFTLPATIFTLGLFLLVINASIIMMADYFLKYFTVDSFWWALLFSILLSFINSFITNAFEKDKKVSVHSGSNSKVIIIEKD